MHMRECPSVTVRMGVCAHRHARGKSLVSGVRSVRVCLGRRVDVTACI